MLNLTGGGPKVPSVDYTASSASGTAASGGNGGQAAAAKRAAGSGVTRWTLAIKFAADNTPLPCPGYIVPSGCQVRIRANNGTSAGNTQAAFVAEYRERLTTGQGTPLAPFDDIQLQVSNLAQVWAMGKAGDGLVISVQTVVAGA